MKSSSGDRWNRWCRKGRAARATRPFRGAGSGAGERQRSVRKHGGIESRAEQLAERKAACGLGTVTGLPQQQFGHGAVLRAAFAMHEGAAQRGAAGQIAGVAGAFGGIGGGLFGGDPFSRLVARGRFDKVALREFFIPVRDQLLRAGGDAFEAKSLDIAVRGASLL